MRKIIPFILLSLLFAACSLKKSDANQKTIYVTITPLKAIIEEITCGDFSVEVIVPDGASPEIYEPTAKQLAKLNEARLIFSTGLINFERSIVGNLDNSDRVFELHKGIELIEGSCSHGHHHHSHGVDPHVWTSPKTLRTMVVNARDVIAAQFPDKSEYIARADELLKRIDELDAYCQEKISSNALRAMMIYHPAYTYYAHDYGIEQIAIEHDGKEPTPRQLATLIDRGRNLGVKVILYQPQYNVDKVTPVANGVGVECIVTNPLAGDILGEIRRVTDIICGDYE